jgi:Leucine-rich repeat (LRR) protein
MDSLDLSNSRLEELPDLSHLIVRKLLLQKNSIEILFDGTFPIGIEEVFLDTNCIGTDGVPTTWPDTLTTISLSYNMFRTLDTVDSWPSQLRILNLSNTDLKVFPLNLPNSLETINISNTFIKNVSYFPPNLKEFYAQSTGLKFLPIRLPNSLEILNASEGSLRLGGLPTFWGESLKHIDLHCNFLKEIPRGLEGLDNLEILNLSYNSIVKIGRIPASVRILHLAKNRILEIPGWLRTRHLQITIHDNQITDAGPYPNCITIHGQWFGPEFLYGVRIIQRVWKTFRMRRRLKSLRRMALIRENLLGSAMHPSRAGRFEGIDGGWN